LEKSAARIDAAGLISNSMEKSVLFSASVCSRPHPATGDLVLEQQPEQDGSDVRH